ncbi:hypothetical protein ACWIEX_11120 [Bosea sp. NPDC055353]
MALDEIKKILADADGGEYDYGDADAFHIDARDASAPDDDHDAGDAGSEFLQALDLNSWTSGERMDTLAARLEREVELAAKFEDEIGPRVMAALKAGLPTAPDRSTESGIYTLTVDNVVNATRNILFNGCVEAADGTRITVPTLPVTVYQIGICMTSYQGTGDGGTIGNRLYRQDIMRRNEDPEREVLDFLSRRARRKKSELAQERFGDDGQSLGISDMMCRALMIYVERAMLCDRSQAAWRMGHGGPMPHELITGSGRNEMSFASMEMLRRLLLDHKRFIFVPSEISDEAIVTIANALKPLQYAVLRNTRDIIEGYIQGSSFNRPNYQKSGLYQAVRAFQEDAGSKVVLGVYRASAICPGQIFYAHEDHVHEAAQIVMADSALQEARGFPNLIDVADRCCKGIFDASGVSAQVHAALARTGSPFRFLGERSTRA